MLATALLLALACTTDADCRSTGGRCSVDADGGIDATCRCVSGACARRTAPGPTAGTSCRFPMDCRVDLASGTCTTDGGVSAWPPPAEGPACGCVAGQCHVTWIEPVACRTNADCGIELLPVPRPVKASRVKRGRPFRPCIDGERQPVCDTEARRCVMRTYKC
jgi:hypothetical protein